MKNLKQLADKALAYLKEAGADEASASLSISTVREINYLNGEYTLFRTVEEHNVGMQAIKDARYASIHNNRLDEAEIKELAANCLTACASAEVDEARRLAPEGSVKSAQYGDLECDEEGMFKLLDEFINAVNELYPDILLSELYLEHAHDKSIDVFSNGGEYRDETGIYSVNLVCSSVEGELSSSFFYDGLDFTDLTTPLIEREPMKSDLKMLSEQYKAEALTESFTGKVVMTPACVDEMLYYTLSNFTGNNSILTGSSPWLAKLGEEVIDKRISVEVAPLDERFLGGSLCTSEGFEAENYTVLDHGVLKSFSINDYVARKTGQERAKNSQHYSYIIVKAEQETPLEEIIKDIDKGLYMMRFSGGSPANNGDFSGVAKNCYLIENGKITKPLREVMINGNLEKLFQNIHAVSNEKINNGGSEVPYISFDKVFISGN